MAQDHVQPSGPDLAQGTAFSELPTAASLSAMSAMNKFY